MPRLSMPDPFAATVGQRIYALRREKQLTIEQLANRTGVSKGHLSSIENGLVPMRLQTAIKVARGLDLKLVDLFTFPEEDERQALLDVIRRKASPLTVATLAQQLVWFCDAAERIADLLADLTSNIHPGEQPTRQ